MIELPAKWEHKIKLDIHYYSLVRDTISKYSDIIDSELFFFPEYTDHGLLHLKNTIDFAEKFIKPSSYDSSDEKGLGVRNVSTLILSILLHDLGMHISFDGFQCLLNSKKYLGNNSFRKKSWLKMWDDYFQEAKRWNDQQKNLIFGKSVIIDEIPTNKGNINQYHKMLVGEFLRRNHHLLAFDIATIGYPLKDDEIMSFLNVPINCDPQLKNIVGMIAYSHGINLWDALDIIDKMYTKDQVRSYNGIKIPFIMTVLRISDLFDINSERANKTTFNTNKMLSPKSNKEWLRQQSIEKIDMSNSEDPELIFVGLNAPPSSEIYLYVQELLKSIQYEMDVSWAVIGRIYGNINKDLKLSFRRIDSNLKSIVSLCGCKYVAEQINFNINRDTLELLVGPLYGYEPSFAIRELVQNSVDACLEKESIQKITEEKERSDYVIKIQIKEKVNGSGKLIITDNGIGMDINTIKNYYLVVGATYRKSKLWVENYVRDGYSVVARNGRFGVGVLAGFLLGDTINVETKKYNERVKYTFCVDRKMTQIEVIADEIDDPVSGTKIEIDINSEILSILKTQYNDPNFMDKNDNVNWCNWYYGKNPKLMIEVPNSWRRNKYRYTVDLTNKPTKGNWQTIYPKDHKKLEYRFGISDYDFMFYNGIVIPNYYFEDNILIWDIMKPCISVIDNNSMMSFDLQRTHVLETPAKKELFENIYKDIFIKFILSEPIKDYSNKSDFFQLERFLICHDSFRSNASHNELYRHYILKNDGFAICHRFFINKMNIRRLMVIQIDSLRKSINKNILDDYTVFVYSKELLYSNRYGHLYCTGFDLTPEIIFRPLNRIMNHTNAHKLDEHWGYIKIDPTFVITSEIIKRIEKMPKDIKEFGYYRCEMNSIDTNKFELSYFEKLLRIFLGNDPLIPYEIDKREIKFITIFNIIRRNMDRQSKKIYKDFNIEKTGFESIMNSFYALEEKPITYYQRDYMSEESDGWKSGFFNNRY